MNLLELKKAVDIAIESVIESEDTPENTLVSMQIDGPEAQSVWSDFDLKVLYDGNACISGCVILGQYEDSII